MGFEERLSLIVGLRNNLDYTKAFYDRVRLFYHQVEIVFVSFGSTDGTHDWLENLNDDFVKFYYSNESKSLSHTYNKGVELASCELVSYLHNDIIIGKGFVENLVQSWEKGAVLLYTTVEPPIFSEDKLDWKTIKDFGTDLETLNVIAFDEYVEEILNQELNPVLVDGHSFFICVERSWLIKMGGLDTLFYPMFCEDSDLMMRFYLQGAKFIHVPKSIAYHFVSKTSRYSKEFEEKSKEIGDLGLRNYYRKWRSHPKAEYRRAFDLVAVVKNATADGLYNIEPFFAKSYVDQNKETYIQKYQKTTKIDLTERVDSISELPYHDIIVYLDEEKLNDLDFQRIRNLSDIISKNELKSKKLFKRIFKNYKEINSGNIRGKINNFRSFEFELPIVVIND